MIPLLGRALARVDGLSIVLLAAGLAARVAGLPFLSRDAEFFFVPWFQHLSSSFPASIAGFQGNYNFPYVYLLWLSRLVLGPGRALLAVKAVSIFGDLMLSAAVALVAKAAAAPVSPARAFALAWCIPTVILNSSVWGQCDAIYTAFLVASVAAAIRGRGAVAAALIGVAFSFKLQAVFIGPFVLLLIWQRRISAAALLAGVGAIVLMMLPADLAGRPPSDLLTVYLGQAAIYPQLALLAPNPWTVLKHLGWVARLDGLAVALGIALAGAGSVAYLMRGRAIGFPQARYVIEAALVSVFMCPFLLPKMHDRYFFPADVLSVTLAIADERWWITAVLVQIGSLTAYCAYLLSVHWLLALGIACNSLVFFCILVRWFREGRPPPKSVARLCGAVLPVEG